MGDPNVESQCPEEVPAVREEILALMQNAWDLMEFAKTQQWRAAYYALLLFAAIAGILETFLLDRQPLLEVVLSVAVAALGATFAIWTIYRSHCAQWKARKRVVKCSAYLSRAFNCAWDKPENFDKWRYQFEYAAGLTLLTLIGFGAIFWIAFCF